MKKIITTCVLALLFIAAKAQHCPYDYSAIIVLHITDSTSDEVIKNLKVTLLDYNKKPLLQDIWTGKEYRSDSIRFLPNPERTTATGYIDNENPFQTTKTRFWFAKDNYLWVCDRSYPIEKCFIKIEDLDSNRTGGRYATAYFQMSGRQVYPLCTHFSHWDLGEQYGFIQSYEPVHFYLSRFR